ncbi:hypothetical protein PRZ48_005493 [Zasmidium cellare]|uniref:Uncharacterized protein n=1 Tax=Zasmidium cellare TaxID=395010 RepID=A0ABR0ESW6_ZASCE|nr:hypothetical protein PRZ48_005493 [Zasmidium cellare]
MSRTDKVDDIALQLEEADAFEDGDGLKSAYIANDESSHKKTKAERRFITKCDLVIIPLGCLLYFVAYVDRNSIGNARVLGTGMQKDLGLSEDRWSTLLSMFSVIYWAATISGAFSGLIVYAVGNSLRLDNTGRESWRWLLIIEGSMAMFVGLLVWLILPPSPDKLKRKTWLLSSDEVLMALQRSSKRTQLFSVIPYACASAVIPLSLLSDRLNIKGPFLLGTVLFSCIGYIILLCEVSVAAKMVAVCIAASGLYTSVILLQAWIVANMAGYTKRATTWAMAEIFGQCFGVMASHVYNTPPRFIKGHAIVLGMLLYAAGMIVVLMWWMMRANKQKMEEKLQYESEGRVHPHKLKSLEDVQDFHIDFKYII